MNLNNLADPVNDPWRSHRVPLLAAIAASTGNVLEVGAGYFSTPMIAEACAEQKKLFVSVETDPEWCRQMSKYGVVCRPHYEGIEGYALQKWGVVFLDHSPGWRRAQDALVFVDCADFVVVHDWSSTEISDRFTPEILSRWRAVLEYRDATPATLILCRVQPPAEMIRLVQSARFHWGETS